MPRGNLTRVSLGELGEWGSGGTPLASRSEYYGGSIPWLIIEDLNDGFVDKSTRAITEAGLANSSAKVVPPGTLLVAMYGSIGKLGITRIEAATNQAIAFCKCDPEKVNTRFLFYLMGTERNSFLDAGRGGTQQNISQDFLKNYEVYLPSLPEQDRAVELLSAADRLRRMRTQARDIGDGLLGAVFLETFGDLEFQHQPLRELAVAGRGTFVNGPFGSDLLTRELVPFGTPVIYIRDISQRRYERVSNAFVTKQKAAELNGFSVRAGDVLIAKVGDPPGIAAVYPPGEPDGIVTQDVIRIRLDMRKMLPEFLREWLNSNYGRRLLRPITVQGTRERFGLTPFKDISVPVPPLNLQKAFLKQAIDVDRIGKTSIEAHRQSEHLFQSLLHEVFGQG